MFQLSTQSLLWLFRRTPRTSSHALPFYLYQINLISASFFTLFGAILHSTDPLPTESTNIWKAFLITLSSTPILFPIIITLALTPKPSASTKIFLSLWFVFSAVTHLSLIIFELDLSLYLPPTPPIEIPASVFLPSGLTLDGRSVSGAPYHIKEDYLTSIPSYSGLSVFPHCIIFTVAAVYCMYVCETSKNATTRLKYSLRLMVFGQVFMVPVLLVMGVRTCFDCWHVVVGSVMQGVFMELWPILGVEKGGKGGKGVREKSV